MKNIVTRELKKFLDDKSKTKDKNIDPKELLKDVDTSIFYDGKHFYANGKIVEGIL